jgi:hypothetical protein
MAARPLEISRSIAGVVAAAWDGPLLVGAQDIKAAGCRGRQHDRPMAADTRLSLIIITFHRIERYAP